MEGEEIKIKIMNKKYFFIPHIIVIASSVALLSGVFLFCNAIVDSLILPMPKPFAYIAPELSIVESVQEKIAVLGEETSSYGNTSTFVGSIYSGDGKQALEAYFDFPEDLEIDSSGNFYIPDTSNNVVRKIETTGIVSTVAGTGAIGDTDGAVAFAQFFAPKGVALDAMGNIYISDSGNDKIKKISNGIVSTIVSSGLNNPRGLEVISSTLYIADSENNAIKSVSTDGGIVTLVKSEGLSDPRAIVSSNDGTILYIADNGSHRVLALDLLSGALSVVAGSGNYSYAEGTGGEASFENLWGITRAGNNLYVSDHNLQLIDRVRKINLSTKNTELIYQDTRQQEMIFPAGLAIKDGYIFVMNAGMGTIQKFNLDNPSDNAKFAGKDRFGNAVGTKEEAILGRPNDLALSPDRKWLYLSMNNMVRKINRETGEVIHVLGSVVDNYRGEGTDSEFVRFSGVTNIAINADGTKLFVIDRWNNRIRGIDLTANPPKSFLITGAGLINTNGTQDNGYQEGKDCGDVRTTGLAVCAYFKNPASLTLDPDGNFLYVSDTGNGRIRKVRISDGQTYLVAGSGVVGFEDGAALSAKFNKPTGITIDSSGKNLFVTDTNNQRIRKIDLVKSEVSTLIGSGQNGYRDAIGTAALVSYPEYLEMGADGILYFSESGSQKIRQVDPATKLTKLISGSGVRGFKNGVQSETQFNMVRGLAVDAVGKTLYAADAVNDMIRQIDITGTAAYTDPAPEVHAVSPQEINPIWDKGAGLQVEIKGKNFKYGAKVYFADILSPKVSVQSKTSLAVKVPHDKMKPGWYDATVINLDEQKSTLERGLGITDFITQTPNKTYAYSKKDKATVSKGAEVIAGQSFFAFDKKVKGGFAVSSGDVTGDGLEEIIVSTGDDQIPEIKIFDKDKKLKTKIAAFDKKIKSGARIAMCDINGDGAKEIIAVPGSKAKSEVKIFKSDGKLFRKSFLVFDKKFSGGLYVACGNVSGDAKSEIIISAGAGGSNQIWVYSASGKIISKINATAAGFKDGLRVAAGNVDGGKYDEIIAGTETGAPQVLIFKAPAEGEARQGRQSKSFKKIKSFAPISKALSKGVSVGTADIDGNGIKEIIVGAGKGSIPLVKIYNKKGTLIKEFYAYSTKFRGGVNVSGGDVDADGLDDITVIPQGGGTPQARVIRGITLK
ncbi:MAG TPA: hypothetical protein VI998_02100 [Patescibacteria group bacterium]|nr:hypothetical protein [Patescibacteria group bacterium]